MPGIFSIFGRSQDHQLLDQALRDAGLHPKLVPEAVKIVMLRQIKGAGPAADADALRARAARLLAYCYFGPDDFADRCGPQALADVETRLEAALDAGDSDDAKLILLFLHTGLVDDSVTARYTLALEE